MKWKVATYIDLEPTRELWKQTKIHQRKVTDFCQKIKDKNWYHSTDCAEFGQYVRSKSKYIDNLKDLVAEYLTDNTFGAICRASFTPTDVTGCNCVTFGRQYPVYMTPCSGQRILRAARRCPTEPPVGLLCQPRVIMMMEKLVE
jgi:hypothetical protein